MRRILNYTILTSILLCCLAGLTPAAAFMGGNIVVCRVGAIGGGALSSAATAVFLDEYTIAGALVQSIPLPTADAGANQILTVSGSSASECLLTRSADARYLLITGYDATVGTAAPNSVSSATIQRVVGRVGNDGVVDTSTTTTAFSAQNIRGATSDNGTNIWMSGNGTGAVYTTFGASGAGTIVSSTVTNLRAINIFGGQLYVSSMSGALRLGTVGTGLPTTTGQTITNLAGLPTTGSLNSPYEYFFADLTAAVAGVDTVYVADDSASLAGVQKYSLVGGTWVANGAPVAPGIRGLTGISLFGPVVNLYATGTATNANTLMSYSDATGYNVTPVYTATTIATASANTAFRGVAFAPLTSTAVNAVISGRVTAANGHGISNALLTLTGGQLKQPLITASGSLGYFAFPEVLTGQTYVLTVSAKRHRFTDPTRVIDLQDNFDEANFVANPQELRKQE